MHCANPTPSSSTRPSAASMAASGDSSPSSDVIGCRAVRASARAPTATNEVCGCGLRSAPGQVRTVSATRPISRQGVTAGSNAGSSARIVCHHACGTSQWCQRNGSRLSGVNDGTIRVPASPSTSSSARTTVGAPPQTQPSERSEACSRMVSPARSPRLVRSRTSVLRVCGTMVMSLGTVTLTLRLSVSGANPL